jgi:hypothetical protein
VKIKVLAVIVPPVEVKAVGMRDLSLVSRDMIRDRLI